jgi:hypothetical protein
LPGTRRLFCPTSQAHRAKIYFFPNVSIYDLTKPSRPHEGRFAIVTIRGAGCDGRGSAQTMRAEAYGQAAWFWLPDAGVKFGEHFPQAMVAKKPGTPGRARSSRKTIAQGVPE